MKGHSGECSFAAFARSTDGVCGLYYRDAPDHKDSTSEIVPTRPETGI